VRELADAITIAFDDLRTLPRPGDADPEAASAEGVVSRTRRIAGGITGAMTGAVSGAMGKVARSVVSGAVETAVAKVTGKSGASAPIKRRRAG
jgi:hypothetical protein